MSRGLPVQRPPGSCGGPRARSQLGQGGPVGARICLLALQHRLFPRGLVPLPSSRALGKSLALLALLRSESVVVSPCLSKLRRLLDLPAFLFSLPSLPSARISSLAAFPSLVAASSRALLVLLPVRRALPELFSCSCLFAASSPPLLVPFSCSSLRFCLFTASSRAPLRRFFACSCLLALFAAASRALLVLFSCSSPPLLVLFAAASRALLFFVSCSSLLRLASVRCVVLSPCLCQRSLIAWHVTVSDARFSAAFYQGGAMTSFVIGADRRNREQRTQKRRTRRRTRRGGRRRGGRRRGREEEGADEGADADEDTDEDTDEDQEEDAEEELGRGRGRGRGHRRGRGREGGEEEDEDAEEDEDEG